MARPFVYVNMAMTADGKITSAAREYPRFTSREDKRTMDRLRAEADAIIVGAGTLRADDPPLWVRDAGERERRRELGKPDALHRMVVSRSLELDPGLRFFDARHSGDRIVVTVETAPAERVRALADRAEIWRAGRDDVDLPAVLARLSERGIERLLLEGGAELNARFLEADCIDEIHVTVAPALLGGRDAPTPVGGAGLAMRERVPLRLVDLRREGDEIFTRWAVVRER